MDPLCEAEFERDEAIADFLGACFDRLHAHIERDAFERDTCAQLVESSLQNALNIVEMAYVPRQEAFGGASTHFTGSWEPDAEPTPCPSDTWVRGTLLTASRPPPTPEKTEDEIKTPGPGSPQRSRRVGKKKKTPPPPRIPSSGGAAAAALARANQRKAQVDKAQEDVENRLREEILIRRQREEVQLVTQRIDEEARERVAELQKELRGREYAYDHNGDVVVLAKLEPHKLGGGTLTPAMRLRTPPSSAHRDPAEGKDKEHAGPKKTKGIGSGVDYVEKPAEGQPSALETMKLRPGVSVAQGTAKKAGPPRQPGGPGHQTKAEYVAYAGKQRRLAQSKSFTQGGAKRGVTINEPGARGGLARQATSQSRRSTSGVGLQGEASLQRASSMGGGRDSALGGAAAGPDGRQSAAEAAEAESSLLAVFNKSALRRPAHELPEWAQEGRPRDRTDEEDAAALAAARANPDLDALVVGKPDFNMAGGAGDYSVPKGISQRKPTAMQVEKTIGRDNQMPRARAAQATGARPKLRPDQEGYRLVAGEPVEVPLYKKKGRVEAFG